MNTFDEENFILNPKELNKGEQSLFQQEEMNDILCEQIHHISPPLYLNEDNLSQEGVQEGIQYSIKPSYQYDYFNCNPNNEYNQEVDSSKGEKSKKEILKEKRERKKLQVQERKCHEPELGKQELELPKENKIQLQRMKNRQSAQMSRDRKKLEYKEIQQNLKFLSQENKQLQTLLHQSYTCLHCGFQNSPNPLLFECTCETITQNHSRQLELKENCISCSYQRQNQGILSPPQIKNSQNLQPSTNQHFDFSRVNAPILSPINVNFRKGVWSISILIFLVYMLLILSDNPKQATITDLRNLKTIEPYQTVLAQCNNFTQNELTQCLLQQIVSLQERVGSTTGVQMQSTQSNNWSTANAINQNSQQTPPERSLEDVIGNFCDNYENLLKSNENESVYYTQLSNKLNELHNDKLEELRRLQQRYCQKDLLLLPLYEPVSASIPFLSLKSMQNNIRSSKSYLLNNNKERQNIIEYQINPSYLDEDLKYTIVHLNRTLDDYSSENKTSSHEVQKDILYQNEVNNLGINSIKYVPGDSFIQNDLIIDEIQYHTQHISCLYSLYQPQESLLRSNSSDTSINLSTLHQGKQQNLNLLFSYYASEIDESNVIHRFALQPLKFSCTIIDKPCSLSNTN